jgi:YidC/Oxa1 family membrane protein insertase
VGAFFDLFLIDPLTNFLVLLTHVFFGNVGVALIILTVIIRGLTLPLTMRQMRSTRAMAAAAPRIQEIQKKYKDPRRRSEEQMKIYREAGINPLGCLSSMIIQIPILMALYRTIRLSLGSSPEAVLELSDRLYAWDYLRGAVPINEHFLWLDLGRPDPLVIPVLTAITTFAVQKVSSLPAMDERQRAQMSMMNFLMPLIFAWITLTLPSGLGLYYVLSNVIGIVMQYAYVGGGPVNWRALIGLSQEAVLPRALEQRTAQMAAVTERLGSIRQPDDQRDTDQEKEPARASGTGRRRRRYSSGRRRGRR